MKSFPSMSEVLFDYKSNKVAFRWNVEMQLAFQTLKKHLTSALVISYPYLDEYLIVETDESGNAFGAVVFQNKSNGNIHLLQFSSITMKCTHLNYSA